MDGTSETVALLPKAESPSNRCCYGQKFRFFCTLGIVLLFFKGGEEMASATRKQYVYFWCEEYVDMTMRIVVPANKTSRDYDSNRSSDGCSRETDSSSIEHRAQVMASNWDLYFSILNAILLFFSLSVCGTLSDYLGRKPFVCLSLTGYALKTTFFVIIIQYKLHIAYMFVSYTIDGICGSSFAFSLFSYTMTADITHGTKERVMGVTIMETLISIGRCTTQFGNGFFIKDKGYFYPMLTASIAAFLSLFLAIILIKETNPLLTNVDIQNTRPRVPNLSTLVRNYVSFYVGSEKDKAAFWVCFSVFFILEFGILGRFDALTLYQLGSPFCWSSETIGLYNGAQMVVCYVLGSLMLKPLQLCFPEHVSASIGILSAILFNVVTAFAGSTATLFSAIVVGVLMILPKSILRGMASGRAKGDKQGAMFAGLSSSELVCKLIASPASLALYSHTLNTMKGAVFLALGGVNLIALVIMVSSFKLFKNTVELP